MLDDQEKNIGDFNFNWGRTTYEFKDQTGKPVLTGKYNFTNTYADFSMEDLRAGKKYHSKRPVWDEGKGCFTMTFNRRDYQASAKNFQLLDEEDKTVAELGKMEDGYYRLEFAEGLDMTVGVCIAMTRFHV